MTFRHTLACAGLVIAVLQAAPLAAQEAPDREAILAVVRRLFDGMRQGDSTMVRSTFHPRAQLASAQVRHGNATVEVDAVDEFVRAVGRPHKEVWDERTRNERLEQDGTMASVWAEYAFYAGSRFSHCGVDAFLLAKEGNQWKIVSLIDTRRREGCTDWPAR